MYVEVADGQVFDFASYEKSLVRLTYEYKCEYEVIIPPIPWLIAEIVRCCSAAVGRSRDVSLWYVYYYELRARSIHPSEKLVADIRSVSKYDSSWVD